MKRNLKKWLSAAMVLCLIMGLWPAALAEDESTEIAEVEQTEAIEEAEPVEAEVVSEPVEASSEEEIVFDLFSDEPSDEEAEQPLPVDEAEAELPEAEPLPKSGEIPIDAAHFPDSRFRDRVQRYFDTDESGTLSQQELNAVTRIDVSETGDIASLKGIEYFPELTELNCLENDIVSLDVSKNTKLEMILCRLNPMKTLKLGQLSKLKELTCFLCKLTELDISGCPALETLVCDDNAFRELDIRNCPKLIDAYVRGDHDTFIYDPDVRIITGLTPIDEDTFPDDNFRNYILSNLDKNGDGFLSDDEIEDADWIDCSNMGIKSLKGLDRFTNLLFFHCNGNELSSLDVSGFPGLQSLECADNALTKLDLSKNNVLFILDCSGNQLSELNLSAIRGLSKVNCSGNPLKKLVLGKDNNLHKLHCADGKLTQFVIDPSAAGDLSELDLSNNSLRTLDLRELDSLVSLNCSGNGLTELYLGRNADLETLSCTGNALEKLDIRNCEKLIEAYQKGNLQVDEGVRVIYDNSAVLDERFPDPGFYAALLVYDTDADGVLSKTEIAQVKDVRCADRGIQSLEGIQYLTALEKLFCEDNALTALDLSKNTRLQELKCCRNALTSLDLSKNTALEYVDCYDNQLTSLVLGKNTKLIWVDCSGNKLSSLDLSKNTALHELICGENRFDALDLSKNKALINFYCSQGRLSSVNFSGCTKLEEVSIEEAHLEKIDLSGCAALKSLQVGWNDLTRLDLSGCPNLDELEVHYNQLETLDVTCCPKLTTLVTYMNGLPKVDISECPDLIDAYENGQRSEKEDYVGYENDEIYLRVDHTSEVVTVSEVPVFVMSGNAEHEIYIGEKFKVRLEGGAIKSLKSSAAKTAEPDARGVVTGKAEGDCKLTVTPESGKALTLKLKVKDPHKPDTIEIADPGVEYLGLGDTLSLETVMTSQLEPAQAKLKWKSSRAAIASVDQSGVVTGKKAGAATITVTTDNKLSASIDIEVKDVHAPTNIAIKPMEKAYLGLGDTYQLAWEIGALEMPAREKLTFKSGKAAVASVDKNGLVTGKKAGTATITVTTDNKLSATIDIEVVDVQAPTSIAFKPLAQPYLKLGEKVQLEWTIEAMEEPAREKLSFKSGKAAVASVDKNGLVTGKKAGHAAVTVTTDNKLSATIEIEVVDVHAPTSIAFTTDLLTRPAGTTLSLLDEYLTVKAIEEPTTKLTWRSSKAAVASVDRSGNLTFKKPGEADITVTTGNKLSATLKVVVE